MFEIWHIASRNLVAEAETREAAEQRCLELYGATWAEDLQILEAEGDIVYDIFDTETANYICTGFPTQEEAEQLVQKAIDDYGESWAHGVMIGERHNSDTGQTTHCVRVY